MNEIKLQENCDKCGASLWGVRGYSSGGLCWNCWEELNRGEPFPSDMKKMHDNFFIDEINYIKDGKYYNRFTLIHFILECEMKLRESIQRKVTDAGYVFAYTIKEYDVEDKIIEILQNRGNLSLEMLYFFTNDPAKYMPVVDDSKAMLVWNLNAK